MQSTLTEGYMNEQINDINCVSVIIPAYNVEQTIKRCIMSIINQTYVNLEIIVINDGSTDKTGEICQFLSETDPRISIITTSNCGPSRARNLGMRMAKGRYLCFADADDYLEHNILYDMISVFRDTNVQMVVYGWFSHEEGEVRKNYIGDKGTLDAEIVKRSIVLDNTIYGGGFLWNKIIDVGGLKSNEKLPLFNETLHIYEDKCWLLDILDNIEKVYISDRYGYHYFISHNSLSHKKSMENTVNYLKAWSAILNNLKKKNQITREIIKEHNSLILHYLWLLRNNITILCHESREDYCQIDYHKLTIKQKILFSIIMMISRGKAFAK